MPKTKMPETLKKPAMLKTTHPSRWLALAGAVTATTALTPGVANATPSSGLSGTIISKTTILGTDYIRRQITIEPGGSTGWHWHDGTLYVYVEKGTLTRNDSDCTTTNVYSDHTSFVEPSGQDNVHIGRNLGTEPLVLDVSYVDPAGSPLSEDAPNPGCNFQ